jgi:hypothetical protein
MSLPRQPKSNDAIGLPTCAHVPHRSKFRHQRLSLDFDKDGNALWGKAPALITTDQTIHESSGRAWRADQGWIFAQLPQECTLPSMGTAL